MRGRGVNYDTGMHLAGRHTRATFDSATVRRDMRVIADELHCTAVRVTGDDPGRLAVAAEHAAGAGLEVWLSPFPCDQTGEQMLMLLSECAGVAERLRDGGADVVLVTGAELGVFAQGFLPGDDLFARTALLTSPGPGLRTLLAEVPARVNAFLDEATAAVRKVFGGPVTYASLPIERVDWSRFDYVGVDAYRAAHNAANYHDEVRALRRHGLPVVVTEFGCCTYRGAAERGARGWLVVDRDAEPRQLDGDYARDEGEQVRYLTELLEVFEQTGVDTAFWFTFANYAFPHHEVPRLDLDLASYGLVKVTDGGWEPKAAFHALAAAYGVST